MGILLALVGAVCLAVGTDVQHRGVQSAGGNRTDELSAHNFRAMVFDPVWLGGTALIGVSVLFQLGSLLTAPLVVVQPIGVVGLVVTAYLGSRRSHHPLPRRRLVGIALCIIGIACFVVTALVESEKAEVTTGKLVVVLICLAAAAVVGTLLHRVTRTAIAYSLPGAVMFGFVATLAQVLLTEVTGGRLGALSLLALAGLVAALIRGSTWVQNAQAKGSSTLVLAGLTVVDPLTGVLLTGIAFGELAGAAPAAIVVMLLSGVVAFVGVLLVSSD